MSYSIIQTLLNAQLQTVAGLPTVQLENTRHEPKTGVAFVRPTLMPIEPGRLSNGYDLVQGLYQIDVFYPASKGTATASAMADLVKAAFARGTVLTGSGVIVHVMKSWREVAQPFEQFYQMPIMVSWNHCRPVKCRTNSIG